MKKVFRKRISTHLGTVFTSLKTLRSPMHRRNKKTVKVIIEEHRLHIIRAETSKSDLAEQTWKDQCDIQ